jgi:uncharacterized protein YcfL
VRECVLGVWLSLSACVGCSCHTTTEKVKIFRVCVFVCSFLVHISAVVKAKILSKTILSSSFVHFGFEIGFSCAGSLSKKPLSQ